MPWPPLIQGGRVQHWYPANRQMPALAVPFEKWSQGFRRRPTGKRALAELAKLKVHHPDLYADFEQEVLFACWRASELAAHSEHPQLV